MIDTNDRDDNDTGDDDDIPKSGHDGFVEYMKWLRSSYLWFVAFIAQKVLPFAIFLAACMVVIFVVLMVYAGLVGLVGALPTLLARFLVYCLNQSLRLRSFIVFLIKGNRRRYVDAVTVINIYFPDNR